MVNFVLAYACQFQCRILRDLRRGQASMVCVAMSEEQIKIEVRFA